MLYAEVPSEVWNDIPIQRDPVTHVNFFNRYNFIAVCQRAGLGIIDARQKMSTYDAWRLEVLVVVARKGHPGAKVSWDAGVAETKRRLHPSRWALVERRVQFRRFPTIGGIRRRATLWVHQVVNR